MPAATATIRVTRETRDLLAAQARERGVSLASMLSELARRAERDRMIDSEREAALEDVRSGASHQDRDWETTVADGIE